MTDAKPRTGVFPNGMAYVTWGDGPRTVLSIPGGPGNDAPDAMLVRLSRRAMRPLVAAGYTVWLVTRRRNMPVGHTVADMADDYAQLIRSELGGRVDVVHGVSYGGLIAQYLAADHPDCVRSVVIHCAACEASDWAKDVDRRWATATRDGRRTEAAMAMAEYALPGDRLRPLRRLAAIPLSRMSGEQHEHSASDMTIEAEAEMAFDSRAALPRISVPVLLIAGENDMCFPKPLVEDTARLIPGCTVVWYAGQGHVRACASKRVGNDVLAFVAAQPASG